MPVPVFVERRIVRLYADCLLESSFKPARFSVVRFYLIQVNVKARRCNINVIGNFGAVGTVSLE